MSNVKSKKPSDWLALGLITLVVLAFYAPVWLLGKWMPSGGGDLVSFIWPTYTFAGRMLRGGQLPLWNPHLYSGAPFWADNQSGVLYPPNWLLFALPSLPYWALEGMVMAHIWFTGVAMYACLRLIDLTLPSDSRSGERDEGQQRGRKIDPPAAALGAIVWMLSDVFITHQGHYNLVAAAAWLPLVFLGTWRGLRDLDWRWAVLGGVAFGIGTLAGHAQITYYTGLLVGAIGLWWIGVRTFSLDGQARFKPQITQSFSKKTQPGHDEQRASEKNSALNPQPSALLKTVGMLVLVALIGLGLSAGGWLPALEMTQHTARAGLSYEEASRFSLAPQGLVGLVAPWVYGRGPFRFTGPFDRVAVGYIGVTGLALAIVGMARCVRKRQGWAIFLMALWIVAFLAALGSYFPFHRLLYDVLPGFQSIRAPARFVLLVDLAWAMLAALGLETIPWERLRKPDVLPWLVVIPVAAELIGFGAAVEVQDSDPSAGYAAYADAVSWLSEQPDKPFRVDAYFPADAGWQQPDFAALYGGPLYDIYGIFNPLTIATYQTYYLSLGWRGSAPYHALGAKYVITAGEAPGDATFVPVHQTSAGLTIYQNSQALPMAQLVYHAVEVDDQAKAWELIHAPDWDARLVVYVEGGPPLEEQPPERGASLAYTRYEANRIDLIATTSAPAYLVLSEVYYPGWQATVDGRPVPVYRANSTFRAIYLGQRGEHTFSLVFRPTMVYVGLAISIMTVLVMVGLSAWLRKVSDEPRLAGMDE